LSRTEPRCTTEDGSFWRQAHDVEDLRTHLGLDQLTIVWRTRLAITYAVQYPDRVAGMLLITPPGELPPARSVPASHRELSAALTNPA
jgi:pimeloyl-ACP methyl ester carboxylesterase